MSPLTSEKLVAHGDNELSARRRANVTLIRLSHFQIGIRIRKISFQFLKNNFGRLRKELRGHAIRFRYEEFCVRRASPHHRDVPSYKRLYLFRLRYFDLERTKIANREFGSSDGDLDQWLEVCLEAVSMWHCDGARHGSLAPAAARPPPRTTCT
ncbi:hypothetical protein EVAR_71026_1 [Eumeta japonica]|uniref:Uncharacterized protein n=1 Tax=Eumeta variegata TaxID=151549 RepID=A0A4C1SGU9_EUMVA|nr:hypothetical protein EVAR_71026_1 [Eumeta japonica]